MSQLTREQFELVCHALEDAKQKNSFIARNLQGWAWHEQNVHGRSYGYLEKRVQKRLLQEQAVAQQELIEPHDPAQEGPHDVELMSVDFYVVYSSTYRVPVLYLNAFDSAGSPLSLDRIHQSNLFNASRNSHPFADEETTFPAITQGEHPKTAGACYYLHPCETETMMKEVLKDETVPPRQYIETWLMLVGGLVDFRDDANA